MNKNPIFAICVLAVTLFLSHTAYSCSCSFGRLEGSFSTSEAVFIGKVVKTKKVKQAEVSLLMKESGTLELLENPRWQKTIEKVQSVTFEIVESFKGVEGKTFVLTTSVCNGGGSCGVPFRIGESYLVFAHKIQPMLSKENSVTPEKDRTLEMRLKAEADKFNEKLPAFSTNICTGTEKSRFKNAEVDEIRNFLKNGVWKKKKELPIIYF